jgi:hypothetical protein
MILSVAVLCAAALGAIVGAVWMLQRGIVHGLRARSIVVRGVTYTGPRAFRWGVVCILYALMFFVGAGFAISMLVRELR